MEKHHMERHIAIKKLTKLLGKNFGYRVDPKAPDQDDRDAARANLAIQRPLRDDLREAMRQRCNALLAADQEYQRIKAEFKVVNDTCEKLSNMFHHYRFTAGVSNSMFFMVKAQGDSWEEVIAKLEKERVS
jgi:hypothetical protein